MAKREPKTLKELRKEFRYTIQQVADGTGIPFGTMVGYDCSYRKLSLQNAQKIAAFYGISVDDIKPNE